MSDKVYQIVTEQILKRLEEGTVPWRKTWTTNGEHMNMISKKTYRGVNVFLLSMSPNNTSPYWLTFNQAKKLNPEATLAKGSKSTLVIFWRWIVNIKDANGDKISAPKGMSFSEMEAKGWKVWRTPFLRYYNVFNVDQWEGIEKPETDEEVIEHDPIDAAEEMIAEMQNRPTIELNESAASCCYSPISDKIMMPTLNKFESPEEFYSTQFHELAHSTGHKSRLDRGFGAGFGSDPYAKEELVAEMTSTMLCGVVGIEQAVIDNSAAYINTWMKRIADDPKLVVQAAAQAQKAADYIRNIDAAAQAEKEEAA